jgi:hypothetical protein
MAIEIMSKCIERVGLKDEGQILLPAIAKRMNKTDYPEQSEEVRVQLIDLLSICLTSNKVAFIAHLGEVCSMLGKALLDANPDMKTKAASFTAEMSV